MDLRAAARQIFAEALLRTRIAPALTDTLRLDGTHLHLGPRSLDLVHFPDLRMIALGKAAVPMADALVAHLTPVLPPGHHLRGLVLGTTLPSAPHPSLTYRLGAHPTLNQTSLDAAHAVLQLLAHATAQTLVVFLISGGASAMVDLPLLPPDSTFPPISLGDLTRFHQTLVGSGLPIGAMNTLRKHISAMKGGRLALAAAPATQLTLLVSDVPPSRPDLIASGPTLPDPTTLADCRDLLATHKLRLPHSIHDLLHHPDTPETPKPGHPAFNHAIHHTLLSSRHLLHAARAAARAQGFQTYLDLTPDDVPELPYEHAATHLLSALHDLAQRNPAKKLCLLSAGELGVPLTIDAPGVGGRNQHFALHCALELANSSQPLAVLSAGSDGIDGFSPAAGAVVDETTLARATCCGFDPHQALATFNAYPLLDTLGDTLHTGPTGTNLRDLRILLTAPA